MLHLALRLASLRIEGARFAQQARRLPRVRVVRACRRDGHEHRACAEHNTQKRPQNALMEAPTLVAALERTGRARVARARSVIGGERARAA